MLKFLGRGSAFNTKEGNTCAYIKENNSLLLIDCGSNIFERIMQKNLLDDVDEVSVAITHRHPDHVGSLGDLIFYCYYVKKIKVDIFSEDKYLKVFLDANGITGDKYNRYRDGYINKLDVHIWFYPCSHVNLYQTTYGGVYDDNNFNSQYCTNIFECYSVILNLKGKKIYYSGDTNYVPWGEDDYDLYYIDTCIADYDENVHYNVDLLSKECTKYDKDIVSKIWCMHFDSDEAIYRAVELGFNIVTVE